MSTVRVSPKYQVVIPKRVRELLQLEPGQELQVILIGDRIELIPKREISDMRGFLKGIKAEIKREKDRL